MIFNRCYLLYALPYDASKYTIRTIWSTAIVNFIKWFHILLLLWNVFCFDCSLFCGNFTFQSKLLYTKYCTNEKEIVNNFLVKLSLICLCTSHSCHSLSFSLSCSGLNETIQCCHRINRLIVSFWHFMRIEIFVVATIGLVSFCLRCEYPESIVHSTRFTSIIWIKFNL